MPLHVLGQWMERQVHREDPDRHEENPKVGKDLATKKQTISAVTVKKWCKPLHHQSLK